MRTLILSDIHLGNEGGYDIFAGGEALPAFLDHMSAQGPLHVLLNGDTADFLMNRDELVLKLDVAERQAREIVAAPSTARVMEAFGRVLAADGKVTVRLGNHDIELALAPVQAVFREALKQPDAIAARMVFTTGEAPEILEVGGARLLVTHGEHNDTWNRIDYKNLLKGESGYAKFRYPPGSRLVKTLLNPLKTDYRMRFADLLKPDFQGAVLTAMAVDPFAVKELFQGSTLTLGWQLFRQSRGAFTFADGEEIEPETGLSDRFDELELDPEEQEAMEAMLGDAPTFFAAGEDEKGDKARMKFLRNGMKYYSKAQKSLVKDAGEKFFALNPSELEWKEAKRLAKKFKADGVLIGHTHAARWRQDDDLTYVNTGTWIRLMSPPSADDHEDVWLDFLEMLQRNPMLDPDRGKAPPVRTRFTGAVIEPHPDGGAFTRLVEWTAEGKAEVLGEGRVGG